MSPSKTITYLAPDLDKALGWLPWICRLEMLVSLKHRGFCPLPKCHEEFAEKVSGQHFTMMDEKPSHTLKRGCASLVFRVKPKPGRLFSRHQQHCLAFLLLRLWWICSSYFLTDTHWSLAGKLLSHVLCFVQPSFYAAIPFQLKEPL